MAKGSPKLRWIYVQGLTLLGLLVPVGCYFFIYLPSQQAYFSDRDFRLLTVLSDQIKARIENSAKGLQYMVRTDWNKDPNPGDRIKKALGLIPNLALDGEPAISTNSLAFLKTNAMSTTSALSCDASNTPGSICLEITPEASTSILHFRCISDADTNGQVISLKAKADFDNFVGPRPEFDGLVVARQDGSVVFQRSAVGWRSLNLSNLVDAQGQKLEKLLEGKSSSLTTVHLAGTDYKLFLQPLQISNSIGGASNQWWVGGLVRSGRFLAESLAISHKYLVGFIFLVLLTAASLPSLKLMLMGEREKLTKVHVFFLMLSAVGGSAVLTLGLLNVHAYRKAERTLDTQLKWFARGIVTNLNEETSRMYQQLVTFHTNPIDCSHMSGHYAGNTNWIFLTNVLANPKVIDVTGAAYPFFDQVVWVKEDGGQRQKWTIKSYPTPFISLKERSYFRDARDERHSLYEVRDGEKRFWIEPVLSWTTGESSSVMAIPSTNEVVFTNGVLFMESKLISLMRPVVPPGFGYCVVAGDGRVLFHSDVERNLRENLLIECDNAPSLRAAMLGGSSEIFDVHYRGRAHSFYIVPLPGFNWSLAVFRNESLLDSANFDLLLISVYLLAFYMGLVAVIWLVGFRWLFGEDARWLWPNDAKNEVYRRVFLVNCVIGAEFLIIIMFVSSPLLSTIIGLAAALLGGLFFYVKLRFYSPFGKGGSSSDFRVNYVLALTSVLWVVACVPAVSFFKASHDAQTELVAKYGQLSFAKALQERIARVENDYRKIKVAGDRSGLDALMSKRLSVNTDQPTAERPLDLYQDSFYKTSFSYRSEEEEAKEKSKEKPGEEQKEEKDVTRSWFKSFLTYLRPFHYRTGGDAQGLFRESAVDSSYAWELGKKNDAGKLVLHKSAFRDGQALHISSSVPVLFDIRELGASFVLLFIMMVIGLLVLCSLARFVARRIFLLHIPSEPAPDTGTSRYSSRGQLSLVLNPCSPEKAASKDDKAGSAGPTEPETNAELCVDLSTVKDLKSDFETQMAKSLKDANVQEAITIEHFACRSEDADFNVQKLDIVERLITDIRHPVKIYSAVHPSHFNFLPPPAKAGNAGAETETQQEQRMAAQTFQQDRCATLFRFFDQSYEGLAARQLTADENQEGRHRFALIERIFWESPSLTRRRAHAQTTLLRDKAYYRLLWTTCSRAEQLALHQLAKEGFINSKNPDVPALLKRGLIAKTSELKVANESFRRFILSAFRLGELRSLEQAEPESQWSKLRGPFHTVLLAVALLLFLTQEELFSSAMKVLGVFITSVPTLFNFFKLFQKGPVKP